MKTEPVMVRADETAYVSAFLHKYLAQKPDIPFSEYRCTVSAPTVTGSAYLRRFRLFFGQCTFRLFLGQCVVGDHSGQK